MKSAILLIATLFNTACTAHPTPPTTGIDALLAPVAIEEPLQSVLARTISAFETGVSVATALVQDRLAESQELKRSIRVGGLVADSDYEIKSDGDGNPTRNSLSNPSHPLSSPSNPSYSLRSRSNNPPFAGGIDKRPIPDGRAATIFKSPHLRGASTFLPANAWCTDMGNIFGGFDGEVRSLSVEAGFACRFYQEEGCLINDFTGGGKVLEVGFRDRADKRRWLGSWEEKVASAFCERLI